MKTFILLLLSACYSAKILAYTHSFTSNKFYNIIDNKEDVKADKIRDKAKTAKLYCLKKHYNKKYCFLLDYSLPSGKNRFFIYNLESNKIELSGLVAHGSCNTSFLKEARFSNQVGCGCSSFGKYQVGGKYLGRFGIAYKLYGLESSNYNAYTRNIVLHSYAEVPDKETYPLSICNSLGCVMVSNSFVKKLAKIIDNSKYPILLWVYE